MKKQTAQKILAQVKNSYTNIVEDFNSTHNYLWPGFEEFLKYVKPNDKILDHGCGNGRLTKLFNNIKLKYTGIDNNPALIKIAKKNFPESNFLTGDVLKLPFPDNSFDVVFSIAILHHIPSFQLRLQTMSEIKRVLKPKGCLIITTWNLFNKKLNKKYKNKFYSHLFKYTLLKLIGKSGLDFKDAMIPWGKTGIKRYYHYFTLKELIQLVNRSGLKIITSYKNKNLVIIARK